MWNLLTAGTTDGQLNKESILDIKYSILGDRTIGAHSPSTCFETDRDSGKDIGLHFRSSVALQMPNLEPLLAVGMLPLPCNNPCVGDQILIQWRIERIKEGICTAVKRSTANCEVKFCIKNYQIKNILGAIHLWLYAPFCLLVSHVLAGGWRGAIIWSWSGSRPLDGCWKKKGILFYYKECRK